MFYTKFFKLIKILCVRACVCVCVYVCMCVCVCVCVRASVLHIILYSAT